MQNPIRFGALLASVLTLAACSADVDAPSAPIAPTAPSADVIANAAAQNDEYRIVDNRFTGIHFHRLPCDAAGNPGEFVRVSGEYHVWGRVPNYDPDHEEGGVFRHFQLHLTFDGAGTTQSGRTFDVTERELDVWNGTVDPDAEKGTGTWRLKSVFVDRATGERIEVTGTAKITINANGEIVVDRNDSFYSCDA